MRQGVQGISDIITNPGFVNLDFADVKTVMEDQGSALMGIGSATGENRTADATQKAISSPLLEVSIEGAQNVLLNIAGGHDLTLFEAQDAADIVSAASTSDVNIIFGTTINENLGDEVVVTVIATGIKENDLPTNRQQKTRGSQKSTQNRPTQNESPVQSEPEKTSSESKSDPFGDWDIRRETNIRDRHNSDLDESFEASYNRGNDLFNRGDDNEVAKQNDELDTPPFFKRRGRN